MTNIGLLYPHGHPLRKGVTPSSPGQKRKRLATPSTEITSLVPDDSAKGMGTVDA
jgi:hypothetical protein